MEIDAIDKNGEIGKEKLFEQCNEYLKIFEISEHNLVSVSYSDLLFKNIEN